MKIFRKLKKNILSKLTKRNLKKKSVKIIADKFFFFTKEKTSS